MISIIIVNWNGGKVFKDCLNSLSKLKYKNYEVIVVDNASIDGSVDKLSKKIKLIKLEKNLGFVGGNNEGIKHAKGEFILLLNNDTKVTPDLLNVLVSKMVGDPTLGVIQPKIYLMDKPEYLDNAGSFFTKIGFFEHWGFMAHDSDEFNHEKEIFSAKGACMLIRREVIDKVGLFDKDFFAYFEETDFCWRVWLLGYRIIFYPGTHIYHKVGFTIKRQNVSELNYHYYKNRICSLIKNLSFWNLFIVLPVHLFFSAGISFAFLVRGQVSSSLIIWKAIVWNSLNIGRTLGKRIKVQKMRIKSDHELFAKLSRPVNLKKFFGDFKRVEKDLEK